MFDIISIGECMIELFSDEPLGSAESFHRAYAGDTLNVLVMASRLGLSCGYITRIGQDPFADYLTNSWRDHGIDTSHVKRVPGFTGLHFISLLTGGDREFVYYRKGSAASSMVPDDLDDDYIGSAKILHVSAIPQAISPTARDTVLRAAQIAHSRNVTVSYDTNLRLNIWTIREARQALEEVLPYTDIIFPSYPEETSALLGLDSPAEVVDYFRSKGVGTVAVKCGDEGAWVGTESGAWRVASVAPNGVLDTTGAGDAFVGGFLYGVVRELAPADGARWGAAAAGLKVAGRGGIASQPSKEQVERLVGLVQVADLSHAGGGASMRPPPNPSRRQTGL